HTSLSGLYVLNRWSTSRIQSNTSSASRDSVSGGSGSVRCTAIIVPMMPSWRTSPWCADPSPTTVTSDAGLAYRGAQRGLVRIAGQRRAAVVDRGDVGFVVLRSQRVERGQRRRVPLPVGLAQGGRGGADRAVAHLDGDGDRAGAGRGHPLSATADG